MYNDITIAKLAGRGQWAVLVKEDWRDDDMFSQRDGWRLDTVWRYKPDAERRVAFLSREG